MEHDAASRPSREGRRELTDTSATILDVGLPGECPQCADFCEQIDVLELPDGRSLPICCLCKQWRNIDRTQPAAAEYIAHVTCQACQDRALAWCLATNAGLSSTSTSMSWCSSSSPNNSPRRLSCAERLRNSPTPDEAETAVLPGGEQAQRGGRGWEDSCMSVVETPPLSSAVAAALGREDDTRRCSDADGPAAAVVTLPTTTCEQLGEARDQADAATSPGTPTSRVVMDLVAQMQFMAAHTGKEARRGVSEPGALAGPSPVRRALWTPDAMCPPLPPHGMLGPADLHPKLPPVGTGAGAAGGRMQEEEAEEACEESEAAPLLVVCQSDCGEQAPKGVGGWKARLWLCVSVAVLLLAAGALLVSEALGLVQWR